MGLFQAGLGPDPTLPNDVRSGPIGRGSICTFSRRIRYKSLHRVGCGPGRGADAGLACLEVVFPLGSDPPDVQRPELIVSPSPGCRRWSGTALFWGWDPHAGWCARVWAATLAAPMPLSIPSFGGFSGQDPPTSVLWEGSRQSPHRQTLPRFLRSFHAPS